MGYSCATPIKSRKAQEQMRTFLKEHFRPWSIVAEGTDLAVPSAFDASLYLRDESTLSYDHGRLRLGFNYSCMNSGLDEYVYGVLRWMALRVGRTRPFKKFSLPHVPYIVYDGNESWPVLAGPLAQGVLHDTEQYTTDIHGFKPTFRRQFLSRLLGQKAALDLCDQLVSDELKRLTTLWEAV